MLAPRKKLVRITSSVGGSSINPLKLSIAIFTALMSLTAAAEPEPEPLLELNLAAGIGTVPDYPASDQHHIKTLALPFATYRGESVRANYEGIQADVVKRPTLGVDASIGFSLPSSSDKNYARRGMPDIDTLLEIGPRVYLLLPTGDASELRLILPIRAVVATDLKTWTDRGILFAPGFTYKVPLKENGKSDLTTNLGLNLGTNRLNQYFYQIDPQFALADRPAYRSKAGYIGTRFSLVYSISVDRFRYFVAAGAQSYKGAVNEDSALHRRDYDATLVGGIIWSFFHSDARAKPL